jgi:hypothetical protein
MLKRPSTSDDRSFYGFIAAFFGTILIANISSSEAINSTEPSNPSTGHQENAQEEVKHLQTAQHLGDEADQYADNLLRHFKSGGVCDTYSSMIRRFADTGSPVNIRITKMHKIMDKAHEHNCVRY